MGMGSRRYVDMIVTEGVKDTLRARALVCSAVRRLLEAKGFLEVETPVLEATCGGADARPFVTYHNALSRSFTLRIATCAHPVKKKKKKEEDAVQLGYGRCWL